MLPRNLVKYDLIYSTHLLYKAYLDYIISFYKLESIFNRDSLLPKLTDSLQ